MGASFGAGIHDEKGILEVTIATSDGTRGAAIDVVTSLAQDAKVANDLLLNLVPGTSVADELAWDGDRFNDFGESGDGAGHWAGSSIAPVGQPECTSGPTVRKTDGTYWSTTAYHCWNGQYDLEEITGWDENGNPWLYGDGVSGNRYFGKVGFGNQWGDVMLIESTRQFQNRVHHRSGGSVRPVDETSDVNLPVRSEGDTYAGLDEVCNSGRTTNGEHFNYFVYFYMSEDEICDLEVISSHYYFHPTADQSYGWWGATLERQTGGAVLSGLPGDSGALVYKKVNDYAHALGMVIARIHATRHMFITESSYLESVLGVQIVTTTPDSQDSYLPLE